MLVSFKQFHLICLSLGSISHSSHQHVTHNRKLVCSWKFKFFQCLAVLITTIFHFNANESKSGPFFKSLISSVDCLISWNSIAPIINQIVVQYYRGRIELFCWSVGACYAPNDRQIAIWFSNFFIINHRLSLATLLNIHEYTANISILHVHTRVPLKSLRIS